MACGMVVAFQTHKNLHQQTILVRTDIYILQSTNIQ